MNIFDLFFEVDLRTFEFCRLFRTGSMSYVSKKAHVLRFLRSVPIPLNVIRDGSKLDAFESESLVKENLAVDRPCLNLYFRIWPFLSSIGSACFGKLRKTVRNIEIVG